MGKQQKTNGSCSGDKPQRTPYGARKVPPRLNEVLAILRKPGPHTARTVGEELRVSRDTALRDINTLILEWGMPIDYEPSNHTFILKERVTAASELIISQFTESEFRVMQLGVDALLSSGDTGLWRQAVRIYQKLSLLLPPDAKRKRSTMEDAISFGSISRPIYRRGVLKKAMFVADNHRQCKMLYETPPRKPEWRDVDPYAFRLIGEIWYLIAYCHTKKKVLTFAATRIHKLEETGVPFEMPEKFSLKKFLRGAFGIIGGKRRINVVVRFDASVAYLIVERIWPCETKKVILPDGRVDLHMTLASLFEVKRWIMQYAGECEVLESAELREMVSAAGLAAHCRNRP